MLARRIDQAIALDELTRRRAGVETSDPERGRSPPRRPRWNVPLPEWREPQPLRATWSIRYPDGARFDVEVRPARAESRDRKYDRYEPGPHHLAFHAESPAVVDRVHRAMLEVGASVLDPPTDYSGRSGYDEGSYAFFFADPDGMKLEVAHIPRANP
jgi:glyoxylase I family protein